MGDRSGQDVLGLERDSSRSFLCRRVWKLGRRDRQTSRRSLPEGQLWHVRCSRLSFPKCPVRFREKLESMEGNAFFVPGLDHIADRPGSYFSVVREYSSAADPGTWQRYFFCHSWNSPSSVYTIVFDPISSQSSTGARFISKN